ncbi:MAG: hypothetical protein IJC02_02775 [Lachnospiraceae bacterium]|nr:hypothetical protein [Lachnospiraceae bacterium]
MRCLEMRQSLSWMNGKEYKAKQRLKLCYMVMQDVNHQLFTESELCDFRMERGK